MKNLTTNEIRQLFLDYFQARGHEPVESGNIAPGNDPTLLFTNAGMVQFKDTFLGLEQRPYNRAVTSQKCLRVSGKHNDLENVGPSPRHHTFFEMLGNFSFGDYFKRDAIQFAWDLLVNDLGLPLERLWFSIYTDDDEAKELWIETGAAPERVLRFGKKDNWWSMGDTGPCGPCSEIHFYWGDLDKQVPEGVNEDDEYLEIWNLVFMQYDQKASGEMVNLPAPSVDTGAGLERIASILQGKDNNYDTDAFVTIMDRIQSLLGHSDEQRQEHLYRYRAIADHSRAVTFLISDGILPGNEGRSYVLRMILRRAARFGKLIGFEEPFLAQIAETVIADMSGHYTNLAEKQDFILSTITDEEKRFHSALSIGLGLLDDLMAKLRDSGESVIPGKDAFFLWDTYEALNRQKETSRANVQTQAGLDMTAYTDMLTSLQSAGTLQDEGVNHLIYEPSLSINSQIVGIIAAGQAVGTAGVGTEVEIVLPETPFYVESGGQVSDTGQITAEDGSWAVTVNDTRRRIPGLIVHVGTVESGTVQLNDSATATVDGSRRNDIVRNHTGTHILHRVLRQQLGEHVHQAGSSVAPERLRFDFTHSQAVSTEELADMERRANEIILDNYTVHTNVMGYKEAVGDGATALFGEKYGDEVRVVSFGNDGRDVSMELCGGIHVSSTGEIGSFRIVNETSSAAGVRRIEVVTGRMAEQLITERFDVLNQASAILHSRPDDVATAAQQLYVQNQQLQKELGQLRQKMAQQEATSLVDQAQEVAGVKVLAVQVEASDVDTMRQMTDSFRDQLGSSAIVLGAVINEKPMLVAGVTQDLIKRGLHAGNLVRDTAKIIGGGGGGRPNMAQAGGRDVGKLTDALSSVAAWVESNLN